MSSEIPQPQVPTPPLLRARGLFRLALALGVLSVNAGATVQQKAPAPTPTPNVRTRTTSPKEEAAPAPSPSPSGTGISEAVDEDDVVRVDSNLVLIPASVVDTRGRAVTDLRLEDFELKVDGQIRLISDLSRAETPVNIALLFDNSQSLSAAREFEKQAALRFFRTVIRPIDRAAIYSFANAPKLELPFTSNVSGLVRTIERFGAPAGATALFDTIALAADHISQLAGRKVIVLVSDGADTLSDINFDEALNRTLRAECQIYVVQTRQIQDPNLHDSFSEQLMQKLSEQTGGAVFVPRTVEDLDAAFAQISLDLSQQYLLSYNPQDERKDNYFRFISVSVRARPQLRVRARKGFYPHGAQPAAPAVAESKKSLKLTGAESAHAPAEGAAVAAAPEQLGALRKAPVSGGVLNDKALNLPRPSYPLSARNAGVSGTVVVEVTIDESGNVSDLRVLSGPTLLQQAALNAARQAKFSPMILSGEPVRFKGTINYTFSRP